jgi:hypothetical protein
MAFHPQPSDRSGSIFCLILHSPAPAFAHAMPGSFILGYKAVELFPSFQFRYRCYDMVFQLIPMHFRLACMRPHVTRQVSGN